MYLYTTLIVLMLGAAAPAQAQDTNYAWGPLVHLRTEAVGPPGHRSGGSFVTRADGKVLVAYRTDNTAMLSVVATENEFLTRGNASAANEFPFRDFYSVRRSVTDVTLQRLSSGKILLYFFEPGVSDDVTKPATLTIYESANGLGTDFSLKTTVFTRARPYFSFGAYGMGQPIELGGRILMPLAIPVTSTQSSPSQPVVRSRLYCAVSSDGGATWQFSQIAPDSDYRALSNGFGAAGSRLIVLVQNDYGSGRTFMAYADANALTLGPIADLARCEVPGNPPCWSATADYVPSGDWMIGSHLFRHGNYTYLLRDAPSGLAYFVYRRPAGTPIDTSGQQPYALGPAGSGATWEGPLNVQAYGNGGSYLSTASAGAVVIHGTGFNFGTAYSLLRVGRPDTIFADSFD